VTKEKENLFATRRKVWALPARAGFSAIDGFQQDEKGGTAVTSEQQIGARCALLAEKEDSPAF